MRNQTFFRRATACLCALCLALFCAAPAALAQSGMTVTGTVVDETGEPLIGAGVLVQGSTVGTVTDFDGNFSLTVPAGTAELEISCLGFAAQTFEIPANGVISAQLFPDAEVLSDVVVIGYGTVRKSDLTGSVSNVSADDFNSGLIASPEQLINGKVSGVQIMSTSGSPTAGSTIRIRGGASLNASNDPLIVLDGVPLETGGISGNDGNFLSLINPADIESMTVLKDASSTAIYGSRASNGVIIITTKKGSTDKLKVTFTTTNSIQTPGRMPDMLSRDEFVNLVNTQGTAAQQALLGTASTDWNDEVYRNAFGTDNNLSLSGRIAKNFPIRVSVGYYNQAGVLKTDNAQRVTGNLSLNPTFFDNHLRINFNVKGTYNHNRFANTDAIWNACTWNPTIPVYDESGAYTEAWDTSGNIVTGGTINPLGALLQYNSSSKVSRVLGNLDIDYSMHFLPELKAHVTLGADYASGQGSIKVPADAAQYLSTGGRDYTYGPQKNQNYLLTIYLNYNKYVEKIKSSFDATVGYDYQYWISKSPFYNELNVAGEAQSAIAATDYRHVLLSYYARLNYTYDQRYMLTATIRRDGTSRFSPDTRWGTFPSVALAWRMSKEAFLRDNETLSNLKIRASYGVTGQQDGIGDYNYLPVYTISQEGAYAYMDGEWIPTYRPEAYVSDLKWETTTAWNVGVDFGFLKDRITFSLDYYTRKTKDLLATVSSPAGTNFDKSILTNVGNVDSQGVEFNIAATIIQTDDWTWDATFNATWQQMRVRNLSLTGETTTMLAGASIDGQYVQVLKEGYEPYMFYVYKQLYDADTGKPIEGAYADLNGDGVVDTNDLYLYKSPAPDFIFGFSTSVSWKRWTLSTSLRANVGNYVYNGMAMNTGAWETMSYNSFQLNNLNRSYLSTGFSSRQRLSDYYIENGSFLKMDNLTLSYNFGRVCKWLGLNASFMVQNVFTITKYSGVDPEVPSGMDSSFYTRPRIFSLALGFEF